MFRCDSCSTSHVSRRHHVVGTARTDRSVVVMDLSRLHKLQGQVDLRLPTAMATADPSMDALGRAFPWPGPGRCELLTCMSIPAVRCVQPSRESRTGQDHSGHWALWTATQFDVRSPAPALVPSTHHTSHTLHTSHYSHHAHFMIEPLSAAPATCRRDPGLSVSLLLPRHCAFRPRPSVPVSASLSRARNGWIVPVPYLLLPTY